MQGFEIIQKCVHRDVNFAAIFINIVSRIFNQLNLKSCKVTAHSGAGYYVNFTRKVGQITFFHYLFDLFENQRIYKRLVKSNQLKKTLDPL